MSHRYTPILISRSGELEAIANLQDPAVVPLIEVLQRGESGVLNSLKKVASDLQEPATRGTRVMLDLRRLGSDEPIGASLVEGDCHPLLYLARLLAALGYQVQPVLGIDRTPAYLAAAREAARELKRGATLRLFAADLEPERISAAMAAVRSFELPANATDVLVDLTDLPLTQGVGPTRVLMERALAVLPNASSFRSIIVAGGGFPTSIGAFPMEQWTKVPRNDWIAFREFRKKHRGPNLVFGDYGTNRAVFRDDSGGRAVFQLRYSLEDHFMIYRGPKHEDIPTCALADLCEDLCGRQEFMGASFSVGDSLIDEHRAIRSSSGAPQLWRRIGTSHHLALASLQTSNLFGT